MTKTNIESETITTPTHFNYFMVYGVYDAKKQKKGWRVVGIYGDEEKYEGNRVGPFFEHNELRKVQKMCDELETLYTMPVLIDTIVKHFENDTDTN